MKLYEAMRLGAMIRPQVFEALFAEGGSCAMGAAYEAAGLTSTNTIAGGLMYSGAPSPFTFIEEYHERCPACSLAHGFDTTTSLVIHLNDGHKWSREQIANYLQPLEDAFHAKQASAAQPVVEEQLVAVIA